MTKINEQLASLSNGKSSSWSEQAEYRFQNRKWLRYSSQVARRVSAAIEERVGMNQKSLAELIKVTPQQISKIVQGKENLTLETIAKLADALGTELISFPQYKYSIPVKSVAFVPVKPMTVAYTAKKTLEDNSSCIVLSDAPEYAKTA